MITVISLVTICRCTQLLWYYWLDSYAVCHIPMTYFITRSLFFLILFPFSAHPSTHSATTTLFFVSISSFLMKHLFNGPCMVFFRTQNGMEASHRKTTLPKKALPVTDKRITAPKPLFSTVNDMAFLACSRCSNKTDHNSICYQLH